MAYAYDASLLERIKPRIQQWEATTGRKMAPQMLESLYKQQLETEAARGTQERALDIQQQQLADQKQAQKDAASAAKMQGIVGLGTSAATLGLGYKALSKPSAMSEYLTAMKTANAVPSTGVPTTAAVNPVATPTPPPAIPYGGGLTPEPAFSVAPATGAQTAMAGGAPVLAGAQVPMAGAAPTTGITYGVAGDMGAGLSTATTGAGTALLNTAPMIGAAYTAQQLSVPYVNKIADKLNMPNAAKGWQYAGLPGASIGAGVDIGKKVVNEVSNVVDSVTGAIADVAGTVICSELLRQGRITENDRKKCVLFRFRHIDQRMFDAYTEWATPIVLHMRRRRVVNFILLPFTTRFVGYMIAIQDKNIPTLGQRLAWKYAWWRCSRIANRGASLRLRSA